MDMTLIDALIILVLLAGTIAGFLRGIISQVASIVGFALGIFACLTVGNQATELLVTLIPSAASWPLAEFTTAAVAQGTLFMLVMLTCRVIAFSVKGLARRAKLGLADRLGGSALGAFKNMMVLSLLLNLWFVISPTSSAFTTQGSLGRLWQRSILHQAFLACRSCRATLSTPAPAPLPRATPLPPTAQTLVAKPKKEKNKKKF